MFVGYNRDTWRRFADLSIEQRPIQCLHGEDKRKEILHMRNNNERYLTFANLSSHCNVLAIPQRLNTIDISSSMYSSEKKCRAGRDVPSIKTRIYYYSWILLILNCNYHSSVAESSPQNYFSILINNGIYYISIGLSWYMAFQKRKDQEDV